MLVPMLLFCFDVPTSAALFAGAWNVVKPMLGSISPVTLHPLCDSAHRREYCIILSGGSTDTRQTVALETSVGLPETSVGLLETSARRQANRREDLDPLEAEDLGEGAARTSAARAATRCVLADARVANAWPIVHTSPEVISASERGGWWRLVPLLETSVGH